MKKQRFFYLISRFFLYSFITNPISNPLRYGNTSSQFTPIHFPIHPHHARPTLLQPQYLNQSDPYLHETAHPPRHPFNARHKSKRETTLPPSLAILSPKSRGRSKYLGRNPHVSSPRFVALKHHRLTQLFVRRDLSAQESCASLRSGARSLNHCHRILFTWCGRVGLFPFAGGLHFSGSKAEKDTPSANTPATSRTPRLRRGSTTLETCDRSRSLLPASFLSHASGIVSYEREVIYALLDRDKIG